MDIVTIFSRRSFTSEHLIDLVEKQAKLLNLDIQLNLITDIEKFTENDIKHAPTIAFKGERLEVEIHNLEKASQKICDWIFDTKQQLSCKKIIVPIDYSDNSLNALQYAFDLNQYCQVNFSILHVFRLKTISMNEVSMSVPLGLESSNEAFKKFISKTKAGLSQTGKNRGLVNGNFLIGYPADEIIEYSNGFPESLTIIGQRGDQGKLTKLFGSVSTKLALDSKRNVLIIPPHYSFKPIKKIAFCVQAEKENKEVAKTISNFVKLFDTEFHLINIKNDVKLSEEKCKVFWSDFINPSQIIFHATQSNKIAESIHAICSNNSIDLLSLNRKKRSMLSLILNKSITKQLIEIAKTPLLITHN